MQGIVTTRIDRLTPHQQLVLKVAAVIGRSVPMRVLRAVYPIETDLPDLENLMLTLEQSDFIQRDPLSPDPLYNFHHAITQEVAYSLLPFEQRRQLHADIAAWYQQNFLSDSPAEPSITVTSPAASGLSHFSQLIANTALSPYYGLLAYHYARAGDTAAEGHFSYLAGLQAAAQFAHADAEAFLNRALELTPDDQPERRFDLHHARELVYDLLGQRLHQHAELLALRTLAEQLGGPWRMAEVNLRHSNYAALTGDYPIALALAQEAIRRSDRPEDLPRRAAGYLYQGQVLYHMGDFAAARASFQQALTFAEAHGLAPVQAGALRQLASLTLQQSEYDLASRLAAQAAAAYHELGDRRGEEIARSLSATANYQQGNFSEALTAFEKSLTFNREINDRRGESNALNALGLIYRQRGHYTAALETFAEALELAQQTAEPRAEAVMRLNLGRTYLFIGDHPRAHIHLAASLEIRQRIGDRYGQSVSLANLSLLSFYNSEYTTAANYARQATDIARELDLKYILGQSLTYLGRSLTALGDHTAALTALQQSVDLRQKLNQPHLLLDTHAALAETHFAHHQLAEAGALARNLFRNLDHFHDTPPDDPIGIYDICRQIFATLNDPLAAECLQRALHLLDERARHLTDRDLRRTFLAAPRHQAILTAAGNTP